MLRRQRQPRHQQIDDLTASAARTAALALPLAALLAARSVLRPVRELRDTARRLADGDLDARSPRIGADELAQLSLTVNEMAESLQQSMNTMARIVVEVLATTADTNRIPTHRNPSSATTPSSWPRPGTAPTT
ncbi:HAMP domain-containing protein [Streptomyces sp. T028]|uniref:HAMP domain-containing protein n=1 Tax=Streptomyces sp. T028 TaxID=3394379 RepID=UPI003A8576E5